MKKFIKLSLLFILFSCTSNKEVFWCGDHACVNKAEKKEYFNKNMIVEVRKVGKKNEQKYSKFNEIIKQGKLQKKELLKKENQEIELSRKEQRQKIKDEKKLARQLLKQKRQRIKDEKKIARELKKRNKDKEIGKNKLLTKKIDTTPVSYTHLTLPTTPYV